MEFGEGSSSQISALIVDDDPIIRKINTVILKSLGVKSQVAENGKEAVDLFRGGANFHIVFIDMEMPLMNGIEATRELRAMGVKSKIVGVTSRCSDAEKARIHASWSGSLPCKATDSCKGHFYLEGVKKLNPTEEGIIWSCDLVELTLIHLSI